MQSAKKQSPKLDERDDDLDRRGSSRARLESGYELTAYRSIDQYLDPFVDPVAGVGLDPFDRLLIDSLDLDEDGVWLGEVGFSDDEDDTIRMERPTFEPPKT
ncbi:MAG: hypothetical protein ABI551_05655 [Polyangiaceae bacterium]